MPSSGWSPQTCQTSVHRRSNASAGSVTRSWRGCTPEPGSSAFRRRTRVSAFPTPRPCPRVYRSCPPGTQVSQYVTDEGRSGLLVDDDRVGPELRDLLLDDSRRTEYEKAGRVRAGLFSLDHVVSSYEQLYREVIAARAGRAAS